MKYKIKLTKEFFKEINEIYDYISYNLKAPIAANSLREKIVYNILLLERFPRMFAKIDKIDGIHREYRRIVVNNYVILYTIDDNNRLIYIVHIYYSDRNYINNNLA